MKHRRSLAALVTAVALTLTACADDSESANEANFNDADVTFAKGMIPHHEQAIEMAMLAEDRAGSREVKQLAASIEAAQDPEIQTMTGWLETWGEDVPEHEGGMDHGSGDDMFGMMSSQDMEELEAASGEEFDQMFLTMMTEHHEGAIEMAQIEQADGENPDALALAEKIETDQQTEIQTMQRLLQS